MLASSVGEVVRLTRTSAMRFASAGSSPCVEAIIRAAVERGVEEGSPTADLLRNWLTTKPDSKLLATWRGYIEELVGSLNEGSARELKSSVIGRARAVAEAAGGFLGVGSISAAEKTKLEELEWAFG